MNIHLTLESILLTLAAISWVVTFGISFYFLNGLTGKPGESFWVSLVCATFNIYTMAIATVYGLIWCVKNVTFTYS